MTTFLSICYIQKYDIPLCKFVIIQPLWSRLPRLLLKWSAPQPISRKIIGLVLKICCMELCYLQETMPHIPWLSASVSWWCLNPRKITLNFDTLTWQNKTPMDMFNSLSILWTKEHQAWDFTTLNFPTLMACKTHSALLQQRILSSFVSKLQKISSFTLSWIPTTTSMKFLRVKKSNHLSWKDGGIPTSFS